MVDQTIHQPEFIMNNMSWPSGCLPSMVNDYINSTNSNSFIPSPTFPGSIAPVAATAAAVAGVATLASSVSSSAYPISPFSSSSALGVSSSSSSSSSLPFSTSYPSSSAASLVNSSLTSLDSFRSYNPECNSTMEDAFIGGYSALVLEFTKILYGIVCLVGLCGNTLVLYVVLRFSKMQTVTNMYIFNLALADEMFLIGLPFLIATVKYKSWPFGQVMCRIYMITTSINQFTSSLLLTVMSADRYIAVCHPISSPRYRTPFIAKFICLTVWTVSALLMVPIYLYTQVLTHGQTASCNIVFPENEYMNGQRAFTLYSFTLGFFIPFILIFLFYFLVICKLRTVGPKNKSKEKKRSHRKVTYLVLTVITVYVACWLPYWIGQVYITFQKPNVRHSDLCVCILLLAGCLSYANSAVNPILYAFLSENFKKSFAKAFTCAAGKDVNAALHVENSVFPRTTRGSTKGTTIGGGGGLSIGITGCGGNGGGGGGGGDGDGSDYHHHTHLLPGSSYNCNLNPSQGAYIDHLSGSEIGLNQAGSISGGESGNSMEINISNSINCSQSVTVNTTTNGKLIDHDNEAVTFVNLLSRKNDSDANIIINNENDKIYNESTDDDDDDDNVNDDDDDEDDGNHVELINRNKKSDHQFNISFNCEPSQGIVNYSCCSDDGPINSTNLVNENKSINRNNNNNIIINNNAITKVVPLIRNGITSNRSSVNSNNNQQQQSIDFESAHL
ncbi:tachykinin-like peptides receptor 99D [Panonychus citri]|uniref:tachykinin-like peptides receptor 99D n=1 Tax=Panonychus citri TaxID=50023 RepID=UPI002307CDA1|nr:tachykinin-like peptides receptor 99D [Panonychus citri]